MYIYVLIHKHTEREKREKLDPINYLYENMYIYIYTYLQGVIDYPPLSIDILLFHI